MADEPTQPLDYYNPKAGWRKPRWSMPQFLIGLTLAGPAVGGVACLITTTFSHQELAILGGILVGLLSAFGVGVLLLCIPRTRSLGLGMLLCPFVGGLLGFGVCYIASR